MKKWKLIIWVTICADALISYLIANATDAKPLQIVFVSLFVGVCLVMGLVAIIPDATRRRTYPKPSTFDKSFE